jgi:hypothetical protein
MRVFCYRGQWIHWLGRHGLMGADMAILQVVKPGCNLTGIRTQSMSIHIRDEAAV